MRRTSLFLAVSVFCTLTVTAQAVPRLTTRHIKQHSHAQRIDVEAQIPHINVRNANARHFNQLAQAIVVQRVKKFRADARDFMKDSTILNDENFRNSNTELDLAYSTSLVNKRYVSLLMAEYTYFLGAPHPNTTTLALNYDLQSGKRLYLSDIFKPGSDYLGALSSYSTRVFKTQLSEQGFFPDGTLPKAENFHSWTLTPKGLSLHFDAYQVTAYANGPQDLMISYKALGSIMRSEVLHNVTMK